MKKNYILTLFLGIFIFIHSALGYSEDITVGEIPLTIPSPAESFLKMPEMIANATKANIPPSNHFLCGFTDSNDLSQITSGTAQSLTQLDYEVVNQEMFAMMIAQTKNAMGGTAFEDAISDLSDSNDTISLGQPHMLGTLFEAQDRYAYAMDISVTDNMGNTVHLLIGSSFLHIKDKVIMLSLTYPYNKDTTLGALKPNMASWIDAIVEANP